MNSSWNAPTLHGSLRCDDDDIQVHPKRASIKSALQRQLAQRNFSARGIQSLFHIFAHGLHYSRQKLLKPVDLVVTSNQKLSKETWHCTGLKATITRIPQSR